MDGFERHIERCNSGRGLTGRVRFRIDGVTVGSVAAADAARLAALRAWAIDAAGASPVAPPNTALADAAATLAAVGRCRLRGEAFDVRETPEGPVLAQLDRGAVPLFGVIGQGVHVNGLVRQGDGLHVWVGIRSRDKQTAPGQFDNLVAGGIPAGHDPRSTLAKEAAEEASVPPDLIATARPVGRIAYVMALESGLRRDVLHVYDLDVPPGFQPIPNDDEVERFELWPVARLLETVRDTDTVKFNVNLVLIDLFLRLGLIDAASPAGARLRERLAAPL